tara:strand:+ start:186 stop:557 length:372 start_codon:yes stop_codon:yes gene_type:complete
MAHFAKIENNLVTNVIVAEQDFIDNHCEGTWVQTSYNTYGNVHYGQDGEPDGGIALRGNYAGLGYTYDATNDVFYTPKPFASWTLADTWLWVAPIIYPDDDKSYTWDEDVYQADNSKGWVEVS